MTPEQRLDRVERILILFANSGRRSRAEWRERSREQDEKWREQSREQDEKINMLIQSQMETTEQIRGLAAAQARAAEETADLKREHKLTQQALRAFVNSLRKGGNGNSST